MNTGKLIFAQLMNFVPKYDFDKCVKRYRGNYRVRSFTCWDQYLCLSFAQLTYRESLRDIECCLRAMQKKLYHMGIRGKVSRSTLADANEKRDWRIYADFAQILIDTARDLYKDTELGVDLDNTVYALDATTIDLCLSLFPWAKFRKTKGGIKMHTLLDLRGNIPSFIEITEANIHEVTILDTLVPEPGAFYVMDRGYLDFERLYTIDQAQVFFVTRAKSNTKLRRLYSNPVEKTTGLKSDQTVVVTGFYAKKDYPEKLRRIRFYDSEHEKHLIFLTNNFTLPALTIAQLYKCRWQVELFFKWVKQNLRIKSFFGTSNNAVKTQIWTAISVYVLVAIVKKELEIKTKLYNILQILSITIFERMPLKSTLESDGYNNYDDDSDNQLILFDL